MRSLLFSLSLIMSTVASYGQVNSIEAALNDDIFKHASVGLTIIDVKTGEIVFEHNGDKSLIPASSLKVITTFSALDILGTDYQYRTNIYHDGEILDGGILDGNIIIKGSGDPTLGSPQFDTAMDLDQVLKEIHLNIRKKGITCIQGDIIIDHSIFSDNPINPTWQWNDLANYYAAGVWGFNIHENMYFLSFNRAEEPFASTAIHSISPSIPNLMISNSVRTGELGSGDNAYMYGDPLSTSFEVRGTIPPGKGLFKIKAAMPRPNQFFINLLAKYLEEKGIQTELNIAQSSSAEKVRIATIMSPTMTDIVKEANLKSNNFFCESILRTIANESEESGTTRNGIHAVREYLERLNMDQEGFVMKDGSGLSARNRINTNLLAEFMSHMAKEGEPFIDRHMSMAGKEGSVKSLFKNAETTRIYLKSGSMGQVLSYTGVIYHNNQIYSIAFIVNAHTSGNNRMRLIFQEVVESFLSR